VCGTCGICSYYWYNGVMVVMRCVIYVVCGVWCVVVWCVKVILFS
jgi:hypothetical protein